MPPEGKTCARLLPLIAIALLGVSLLFQAGCAQLPRPFDATFDLGAMHGQDVFERQARWAGGAE